MQKKRLCAIPIEKRETPINNAKWTLEAEPIEMAGKTHLIINVFYKANQNPNYRIFLNQDEYVTQDFNGKDGKLRTGKIDHLMERYYDWNSEGKKKKEAEWHISAEGKALLEGFLGTKGTCVYDLILDFQNGVSQRRLERERKRYTDPIDDLMKGIRELPSGFNKWIEDDVLYRSRYIYYEYTGRRTMDGYCTHCGKNVAVSGAKHNERGFCPACGTEVTYKAMGKSKHVTDRERAAVIQKMPGGFVARYFDVVKDYGNEYRKPKRRIFENKRVFYTNDLCGDGYVFGNFKNVCTRWIHECDENTGGYSAAWGYLTWRDNRTVAALYTKNLKQVLRDTDLRYSELWTLAGRQKNYQINVQQFIEKIKGGNACVEKLIKCGLFNLAKDLTMGGIETKLNEKGRTLNKILGVENDDAKIIIESDSDSKALKLFKDMRKKGKRLSKENLQEIIKRGYSCHAIEQILKYVSAGKALKYLSNQRCVEKEAIYMDYLDMCVKLKMNVKSTFVLFPKHLRAAHDVNVDLVNEMNNQETYKEHNSKYAAIKEKRECLERKFGYEDDEYLVRPPEDAAEIVREGQKLHHCVGGGGYSERMAKGKIAILFLRDKKKPDNPYYTVEVDMKSFKILQYHGLKNNDKDKSKIKGFITKWEKNVLKPLADKGRRKVG